MLINMWNTCELRREIKVYKNQVYMKITRPLENYARPVCIMLDNCSFYYPDTVAELWERLPLYTEFACNKLLLPNNLQTIHRFIDYIQDGFDDMKNKFPEEDDRDKQLLGEMTASFGEHTSFTKEVYA